MTGFLLSDGLRIMRAQKSLLIRRARMVVCVSLLAALALSGAVLLNSQARAADAPKADANATTPPVAGTAVAIDGSHVVVDGRRFKLFGIDAPDVDQTCDDAKVKAYPCGLDARAALAALVAGKQVACRPVGPNQFDEMLARCMAGTVDLARAEIDAGWAIADRTRSLDYADPELAARAAKRGLWQGRFVPPVDWRAGERVAPPRQFQRTVP